MQNQRISAVVSRRQFILAGAAAAGGLALDGVANQAAEETAPAVDKSALEKKLRPYFRPPTELANDFGTYRSPLVFQDGTKVKTAADWQRRRQEIQSTWLKLLGDWPELLTRPTVEYLTTSKRETFTQHKLRLQLAPERVTEDAHLLIPEGAGPFPAVVVVFYDSLTGIGQGQSPRRDYAYQLAKRGFVTLSLGADPFKYYPNQADARPQPLYFHAYEAATCHTVLASLPQVRADRIGIVGHSYGGKWAMFAACFYEKFACSAWSDPGIVFDETRANINYWEPWYLGYERGVDRKRGLITADNPRSGPYKQMINQRLDLHEVHALHAPRPFLVSGGAEDPITRWQALNHTVAVNKLLGHENRVALTTRPTHDPTDEANELLAAFFEYFLM